MAVDAVRTGELCAILARRYPLANVSAIAQVVVEMQKAAHRAKARAVHVCNMGKAKRRA